MQSPATRDMWGRVRRALHLIWRVVKDTIEGLLIHDAISAATTVAFSLLFAMFPFLILIGLATTHLLGRDNAMALGTELLGLLPDYVAETIEPEMANVLEIRLSGSVFTIGALAILISVSGLVESIRYALGRAYRFPETRNFFYRRLTGLVFVAGVLVTLLSIAALNIVVPLAKHFLEIAFPELSLNAPAIAEFPTIVGMAMLALMLIAMHLFLPPQRMSLMEVLPGVVFTLALYWVLSSLFVLYLSRFSNLGATYGGLAGIVVTMLYFQICGIVLIAGAELNRSILALVSDMKPKTA